MATKEVMATAPLLVLLYDRIFLSDTWKDLLKERRYLYAGFSVGFLWLAYALAQTSFEQMGREIASGRHATGLEYLLTQPDVLLRYIRLSFWPSDLVLRYDWPIVRHVSDSMPAGVLIVGLLVATAYLLYRLPKLGFVAATFFCDSRSNFLDHADWAPDFRTSHVLASRTDMCAARTGCLEVSLQHG